jgi:hypothetical protein
MPAVETIASLATVDGDDIYLDPPVRLLAQYDGRWAQKRIGGPKTGRMLDWRANGCNASTAAMILRWFAEDCTAGSVPFPTKPDSAIDPSWYPLRMAEAFWPEADPPGKVELTPEGRIHFRKIYSVTNSQGNRAQAMGRSPRVLILSKSPSALPVLAGDFCGTELDPNFGAGACLRSASGHEHGLLDELLVA